MRIANTKTEIDRFVATLCAFNLPCVIGFEPTGDYHRPLAYVLGQAGFRPRALRIRRVPALGLTQAFS